MDSHLLRSRYITRERYARLIRKMWPGETKVEREIRKQSALKSYKSGMYLGIIDEIAYFLK